MAHKILRYPQTEEKTGLPRSTINAKLADDDDDFPRPIRLGARSVGFLDSEIEDWIERRIRMSRPEGGAK